MRNPAGTLLLLLLVGLSGLPSMSIHPGGPALAYDATHTPWSTSAHVDPNAAQLYTAETLTSARWSVGAIQERFLGRPFWIEPLTGAGVRVAVIDTGIDPEHPDLKGRIAAWKDFVHGRPLPYDDDTHGTHVAGIIAAHGHFQWRPDRHYFPLGARGVAPGAELLVAKAMDLEGDGDAGDVAEAILWALDPNGDGDTSDGAHIINLSIGLETPPPNDDSGVLPDPFTLPTLRPRNAEEERLVRQAIDRAVASGTIVVVAAGNHEVGAPAFTVNFPGTMANVITVGAVDPDGRAAAFSNTGTDGSGKPDLVAPGILLSTFPAARDDRDSVHDGYVALGGTSMSAPMVAGAVALLLEGDPTLRDRSPGADHSDNTERVRELLTNTAKPVGSSFNNVYGHGIIQVNAAAEAADTGNGPPNWSVLLTLLLIAVLGVFAWAHRRHNRAVAARVAATRWHIEAARPIPAPSGDAAPGSSDQTQTPPDRVAAAPTEAPPIQPWPAFDPRNSRAHRNANDNPLEDHGRNEPDDEADQAAHDDSDPTPRNQRPPWSK